MPNIIKIRRGNFANLPAAGTRLGEPRFCPDTGQLFIDDGTINKEISPKGAIITHKGDAGAHHDKYTDANARAAIYGSRPCFAAHITALQVNVTGDDTSYSLTGAIWTELVDQGNNFLNGVFTAPDTGVYLFSGSIGIEGLEAAHTYGQMYLYTNDRNYFFINGNIVAMLGIGENTMSFSFYAPMTAAHTAHLYVRVYSGNKTVDVGSITNFGGSRII